MKGNPSSLPNIWHVSHILKNLKLGENCRIAQNVIIGPNVSIGDNVKVQTSPSTKG